MAFALAPTSAATYWHI